MWAIPPDWTILPPPLPCPTWQNQTSPSNSVHRPSSSGRCPVWAQMLVSASPEPARIHLSHRPCQTAMEGCLFPTVNTFKGGTMYCFPSSWSTESAEWVNSCHPLMRGHICMSSVDCLPGLYQLFPHTFRDFSSQIFSYLSISVGSKQNASHQSRHFFTMTPISSRGTTNSFNI